MSCGGGLGAPQAQLMVVPGWGPSWVALEGPHEDSMDSLGIQDAPQCRRVAQSP